LGKPSLAAMAMNYNYKRLVSEAEPEFLRGVTLTLAGISNSFLKNIDITGV